MKKVPLVVRDPEALDKDKVCESVQMTYADTGSPIVFDAEKHLLARLFTFDHGFNFFHADNSKS